MAERQRPIHCAAPEGIACTGCSGELPPLKWVYRRDGGKCYLCQEPVEKIEDANRDHVLPRCRGGTDSCKNIRLTHRECNFAKGEMLLEEIREMTA